MTPKEAYNYAGFRGTQLLRSDQAHLINAEKELEFVFQARAALEKQIPKKYKTTSAKTTFTEIVDIDICPVCSASVFDKFCPRCGQAIDWGET